MKAKQVVDAMNSLGARVGVLTRDGLVVCRFTLNAGLLTSYEGAAFLPQDVLPPHNRIVFSYELSNVKEDSSQ